MTPVWDMRLGDCLDPVTGLASLADKSVDHVITDPPYEAEAHTKQRRIIDPRKQTLRMAPIETFGEMDEVTRKAIGAQSARLSKRWSLVFCQIEAAMIWRDAMAVDGSRYMRCMIWVKPNGQPQLTGDRPGMGYETIVCSHAAEASHWNAGGARGWVSFPVDANFSREPRLHETQKPLPLMEKLVRDFTDPGDLICDPFAGSGTTGVAAIRLGRRFIGWEKSEKYHAIAVKRLTAAREQLELGLTG